MQYLRGRLKAIWLRRGRKPIYHIFSLSMSNWTKVIITTSVYKESYYLLVTTMITIIIVIIILLYYFIESELKKTLISLRKDQGTLERVRRRYSATTIASYCGFEGQLESCFRTFNSTFRAYRAGSPISFPFKIRDHPHFRYLYLYLYSYSLFLLCILW